jgi:hypothetical protein
MENYEMEIAKASQYIETKINSNVELKTALYDPEMYCDPSEPGFYGTCNFELHLKVLTDEQIQKLPNELQNKEFDCYELEGFDLTNFVFDDEIKECIDKFIKNTEREFEKPTIEFDETEKRIENNVVFQKSTITKCVWKGKKWEITIKKYDRNYALPYNERQLNKGE